MKGFCFRSGFRLQLFFFFCLTIITVALSTSEGEPESSITSLNEWSNDQEGSITVDWKASDPDDKKISAIYFWACYEENPSNCENNDFDDWKLVGKHTLDIPEMNPVGNTPIQWAVIIGKFGENEGIYKLITCSVNVDNAAEYGKESVTDGNGCEEYNREPGEENFVLFNSIKMKDFGFDSVSPVLTSPHTVSGEAWLAINDNVTIEWVGSDVTSGIVTSGILSAEVKYCYWENIVSEEAAKLSWPEEFGNSNTITLTISDENNEGFYYFYPILVDDAGNPSDDTILCPEKKDERLAFDRTQPEANIQPEINGKFAYNSETLISLSVSDNIELENVILLYGYNEGFDGSLPDSSFSDDNPSVIPIKDLSSGVITYEDGVDFDFPDGQGTYRFFLQVDDKNPISHIEAKLTLIYDTEAPVSQIVFGGEGTDITNLESYPVYCEATDSNHAVDKVYLYYRYKEGLSQSFGDWNDEPLKIVYDGECTVWFDFSFANGEGVYQFYTKAIDRAGNVEDKVAAYELEITSDRTGPNFELLSLQSEYQDLLALDSDKVYYKGAAVSYAEIRFVGALSDSLSGIDGNIDYAELNWSLDSNIWSIDFVFNASKSEVENTITLTILDLAGNPSNIIISFEEDNSAPAFVLYNTILSEVAINEEDVLLVKSDTTDVSIVGLPGHGAPIALCELKFGESSEWTILDSLNFKVPEGKNNLSVRVTDSLGNSISQNFIVEYDDEGPEFEPLNPSNNWYSDENNIYVRGPFTIELRASDNSSGMDRIEFRYEGNEWQEYTNPLELFEGTNIGPLHFSYRAIDNLGNLNEHEITFVIDNTATQMSQHDEYGLGFASTVDFSLINFTFVSNSGDASKNSFWNGTADVDIDYNLFNVLRLYPYLTKISDGETGSGIKTILIEYSRDNETWMEYNNLSRIELTSSSIYIRVNVTDNVGNYIQYVVETPIKVINYPIEKEPEAEGNGFFVAVLLVVVAGSVVAYKYRQKQLLDLEKESGDIKTKPVEQGPPPIKCPKCSVLIPAESKSCAFCGTGWDDVGNIFLVNPFADSKKQITKEIIPRTGEILIGSNLDRWKIETGARSSIGGRENNEDSISWNTFLRTTSDIPHSIRLGIIADGVGGHNRGEIASSLVISAINKSVSKSVNDPFHTEVFTPQEHAKILESAYHHGNDIVFGKSQNDEYRGMATTAVSVYLWEDDNENNGFLIGNVGDSRGYLINKEEIKQVTKDDSEVQKLIDEGQITDKEAKNHPRKNVITQAIGNKKAIKPRIETYNLRNSEFDCILLCSDGVSDKITDKEIHKIVNQFDNPQDVCNKIVKIINRTNTNHDNVSLILIKLPNLFAGDY